jgi:hypothetical protein
MNEQPSWQAIWLRLLEMTPNLTSMTKEASCASIKDMLLLTLSDNSTCLGSSRLVFGQVV